MAKIVIFGTGVIARLAKHYFETDSDHQVVAFTVDRAYLKEDRFEGLPVIPFDEVTQAYPPQEFQMFVAVSYAKMNHVRAERYADAKKKGYQLASYISSRCTWLTSFKPGDNCFILEDNTIQPFVRIGNDVTLWSGNHIGHDSQIGDHVYVTSHVVISGFVKIGAFSFLGVNATLRDNITVAEDTLIGAGAVIMKDTEKAGVYLPERAKLFGKRSNEIEI